MSKLIGHYKSRTGFYHAIDNGSDKTYCGLRVADNPKRNYPYSTRAWIDCDKCKKKIPDDDE